MNNLDRLIPDKKAGDEPFHIDGQSLGTTVLAFWQWSASDLISNALRGRLAEYLVAYAVGVTDGIRVAWDAYDLKTASGIKVEVKSAAYLQSWKQTKPSSITFDVRPTFGWDAEPNTSSIERKRQADVYVFALLAHVDKRTLDPLNVAQWEFYVLSTAVLDLQLQTQKTISLSTLQRLCPERVRFNELQPAIDRAAARE